LAEALFDDNEGGERGEKGHEVVKENIRFHLRLGKLVDFDGRRSIVRQTI
jgi:hypothetical protein